MTKTLILSSLCLTVSGMAIAQESVYTDSIPSFDDKILEEVVVTGTKPLIQTSADKVTYNMDEDPSAQTSTVADAMRKVPMVTVDADGNIKLNGESNFQIYLNGKPNPALTSNYKMILKAMPASVIKKIEVLTEPGAKYDAEGVGGIINIITDTQSNLDGWTATITATGTRQNIGGGVSALAKVKNVTVDLNYNHSYNMMDDMTQNSSIEYMNNPINHRYSSAASFDVHNNFDYGGMQLSWEPNTSNLLTANANLFNINTPLETIMTYDMLNKAEERLWGYKSKYDVSQKYLNYTIGANWQHNFKAEGHNIIFLYQYSHNSSKTNSTTTYGDYFNYDEPIPGIRQLENNPENEHTFQLDYTLPFSMKHTLEFGGKYIMRRNHGDSNRYDSTNGIDWVYNATASLFMNQHQDVAAVYGAYTGKFGEWLVKGGMRYEYANLSSKFKTPGHDDFSQDLNDLVPNAMIAYSLPDYSSIRLSYQMRITRPGMEQLNPYRTVESPMSVRYGNPELVSQKANNIALTYTNFSLPVQLNLTLSYNYTDRMIQKYQFANSDGIVNSTYGNYGYSNQGSLFAYLAYPITTGMRLSVNAGVNYKNFKSSKVDVHNHGWGWNAGGDFTYQMPWDFELSAYGGAGNMGVTFQGKSSVWSYHGLGVTKSLLTEKRMRITLTASNFCTPTRRWTQTISTPDIISTSDVKMSYWNIGVTVSFRLGKFDSKVKRTDKSIQNDDINSSSSNTGGGMGSTSPSPISL